MTPKFAKAVDPVFMAVLDLEDRIERRKQTNLDDERVRVQKKIDSAEALLGATDEWKLAKYALVAWIDARLIEAPWDGQMWWKENPLERMYFAGTSQTPEGQTAMADGRMAFTEFYNRAAHAARLPNRDALETFYICVVMGFKGLYGDHNTGKFYAEQMRLPPTLEDWARQVGEMIHLRQGIPPIHDRPKLGLGAPPLNGRSSLFGMSVFGIVMLAVVLGYLATKFI